MRWFHRLLPQHRAGWTADARQRTPFARRCDLIARDAHSHFVITVGLGVFALITWAGLTELDKVKRGAGRIMPQQQNQMVQHYEGGIITEILVKEGDKVERGQPLLRIDNALARSELSQAELDLKAKRLRMARLEAEVDGKPVVDVPDDLILAVPKLIDREEESFRARQRGLNEQMAIQSDQLRQKELELKELKSRWTNTMRERELLNQKLSNLKRLSKMGAVSENDMIEQERSLAQLESRLSDLVHDVPRTEAAMSEIGARRNEIKLRFQSEAQKERSDVALDIEKLNEHIRALRDRADRTAVLAPVAGSVNKLFVNTVGGVAKSGEPLVQLVPLDSSVIVEARLSPTDRAEVWPGLPAIVKVSAYDYSLYGGISAKVVDVSSDALQDERGTPYFRVRLEARGDALGPGRPILPGMVADVDIMAGKQTILTALLRPVRYLRDNVLRQ